MARYSYQAVDARGNAVSNVETAASEFDLDRILSESGLLLIRATALKTSKGSRASDRSLIEFCYQLSIAFEAGIPLMQALADLRSESGGALADAVEDVSRRIESGSTLSEALAERPREFPPMVQSLVKAGESTGSLDQILRDLVRYLEWREDLRRQLKSAATYPLIVVSGVVGLCLLVTLYVLPSFLGIFQELGVDLPLSTRAMIAAQLFLSGHWLALLVGLGALIAATVACSRTRAGKRFLHATILRMPIAGRLVTMIEASRFAHNLGVLYASGLPIMKSLEMLRDIVQNVLIVELVDDLRDRVGRGEGLSDALKHHELMPPIVLRMVMIGESTGRLDESLERAASFFDREVPALIARAIGVFNTAALLFLGAALVTIVISIFVPLYSMMGSLNAP